VLTQRSITFLARTGRALGCLGLLITLPLVGQSPVAAQTNAATVRVSVASDGAQPLGPSYDPSISSDGRFIAFVSDASVFDNLTQLPAQILVHDRVTGNTDPVAITPGGAAANGRSFEPAISGNGRYVAFDSYATNLVSGDTNNAADVFVHDRVTGQMVRVSVSSAGVQGDRLSASPALSADGRYVVFMSQAGNLAAGDTTGFDKVFLHDRDADADGAFDEPGAIATTLVSVASDGTAGYGNSAAPGISADGHVVAFNSTAQNLAGGTTTVIGNLYLHDRVTGQTTRLSDDTQGTAYPILEAPALSADGRMIAFARYNGIYVYDRLAAHATLVSVASDGTPASQVSSAAAEISADGRQVFFQSYDHLADNVSDYNTALFVHDRDTDTDGVFDEPGAISTRYVASASNNLSTPQTHMHPSASASGRYVAFASESSVLVQNDTNTAADVFLQDLQAIQFSAAAYEVDERAGRAVITVNLSVPTTDAVTVHYASSDGSAIAGSDYLAMSGTLLFAPGSTSARFEVAITDDTQSEFREALNLTLDNPTNAALGPRDHAMLTILVSECADDTADRVLGQANFVSDQSNRGGSPSAATLSAPTGIAIDQSSGRLFAADATNHRVLSWPSATTFSNGDAADLVFGQPDFTSVMENRGGTPGAATLKNPFSVAADGAGHLYVADTGNTRVLEYNAPFSNGMAASRVFGQPNFTSTSQNQGGAPSAATLSFPINVLAQGTSALYVADSNNGRVLIYDAPLTGDANADFVLGQPDFTSAGPNQGHTDPDATTLSAPDGLALDANGNLYVADTSNNRVLGYLAPRATDRTADVVLGQPNFTTGGSFYTTGSRANTFALPYGIALDNQGALYVADYNNNRVVMYGPPFTTDLIADRVFGQGGAFESGAENIGGIGAASLHAPVAIALDSAQNLYVVDRQNHRLLAFDHFSPIVSPQILGVDPQAAAVGSSFVLNASGADFMPGAAIRLNGIAQPATFVDSGRLTTQIDSQSKLAVGSAEVTVINPDSCGGISNVAMITITPQHRYLPLLKK
jgi:Tol biopolymer transport system component/sugar lactone lactonase YvrE